MSVWPSGLGRFAGKEASTTSSMYPSSSELPHAAITLSLRICETSNESRTTSEESGESSPSETPIPRFLDLGRNLGIQLPWRRFALLRNSEATHQCNSTGLGGL